MAGKQPTIADLLAMSGVEDVEFDPPRMSDFPRLSESSLSDWSRPEEDEAWSHLQ